MENEQTTLRDVIEQNFEAASTPAETPIEKAVESTARDDKGRFAQKQEESNPVAKEVETTAPEIVAQEIPQRPTTWKKQYLPIYDKLAGGQALTPEESKQLADYSAQREKEYASGVSTYRAEAQNAKDLQAAIEPFLPILQQHNIKPNDWIANLGRAHQTLALGSPEQKLQMFNKLAQEYGVPVGALGQQDINPVIPQMMQYIQNLEGKVNNVASWREQQEQSAIQQQISVYQDAEKYPHFEAVRATMAQLLESGLASDLKTAYDKAIRMDDEVWQSEQERQALASQQKIQQTEAAKQAKAKAVSPKTSTPSGTATSQAKDRRAILEEQMGSLGGRV